MKFYKFFLLIGLISLSLSSYAKEYQYPANCRHLKSIGPFEQCIDKELAFYDGKLNGLYLSLGTNNDLARSELLWIKFKETDCTFMARSSDRNRSRLVYKACILEKTKNRIEDLKKTNTPMEWFRTV